METNCYKLWYVVNGSGLKAIPVYNRAPIEKTCTEECGEMLDKCRCDLRKILFECVETEEVRNEKEMSVIEEEIAS